MRRARVLSLIAAVALGACGDGGQLHAPDGPQYAPGPPGTTIAVSGISVSVCSNIGGTLLVSGTYVVTNVGPLPTVALAATPLLQRKQGAGPFSDVPGGVQSLPGPVLAPGAATTFSFAITIPHQQGTLYRFVAAATILNHPASLGSPRGVEPKFGLGAGPFAACGSTNQLPVLAITAPSDGSTFIFGTAVTLSATALDPEDGDISGNVLWQSDIDGPLGTGASISRSLSTGTHTVMASVSDAQGANTSASIAVNITGVAPPPPPAVTVTVVPGALTLPPGAGAQFTATVTGAGNTAVTWSASGGIVDATGFFTAPVQTGQYEVTATSVEDPSASGVALVNVQVITGFVVQPLNVALSPGAIAQFSVGPDYPDVLWQIVSGQANPGSVTQTGVYTAGTSTGAIRIRATNQADPGQISEGYASVWTGALRAFDGTTSTTSSVFSSEVSGRWWIVGFGVRNDLGDGEDYYVVTINSPGQFGEFVSSAQVYSALIRASDGTITGFPPNQTFCRTILGVQTQLEGQYSGGTITFVEQGTNNGATCRREFSGALVLTNGLAF